MARLWGEAHFPDLWQLKWAACGDALKDSGRVHWRFSPPRIRQRWESPRISVENSGLSAKHRPDLPAIGVFGLARCRNQ